MVHHLLPVKHFHIIFTIPQELRDWFFYNQRLCYNLLFRVAYQTIQSMAGEGLTGMVATLHTWGSNLSFHPHVHCIVPSGSFQKDINGEAWKYSKGQSKLLEPLEPLEPLGSGRFFCDAKVLRERYKTLFIQHFIDLVEGNDIYWKAEIIEQDEDLFSKLREDLRRASRKKWTVRIENPVLGTDQIIEYLARYVRRVAITNSRIEAVTETEVTINYKQYHLQKKGKPAPTDTINFDGATFIQRFAQHIPPSGFHKVRYYGCYNFSKKTLKAKIYTQITKAKVKPYQIPSTKKLIARLIGHDPDVCNNCGSRNTLVTKPLVEQVSQGYHLTRNYNITQIRAGPKSEKANLI